MSFLSFFFDLTAPLSGRLRDRKKQTWTRNRKKYETMNGTNKRGHSSVSLVHFICWITFYFSLFSWPSFFTELSISPPSTCRKRERERDSRLTKACFRQVEESFIFSVLQSQYLPSHADDIPSATSSIGVSACVAHSIFSPASTTSCFFLTYTFLLLISTNLFLDESFHDIFAIDRHFNDDIGFAE